MHGEAERFARQVRFAPLGAAGQARLGEARVVLVGCGALGGSIAQSLARSGVGELVLVDRDIVDVTNLPRQVLFEDRHAAAATPKVEAAREMLSRIGGPTRIEVHAVHVDSGNVEDLLEGVDLVLDGTDNVATRYLVNDCCVAHAVPWIYGGVVGARGLCLAVLPGRGPCLRCVFPEVPPVSSLPNCETDGVLQPAVALVAAMQSGLALRILSGDLEFEPKLCEFDAWAGRVREIAAVRDERCPCCAAREFPFLSRPHVENALSLCGRNAVQVRGLTAPPDLAALARALYGVAQHIEQKDLLLRFEVEKQRITVFRDGRALIEGTSDLGRARALYDRYVAS
jgi:adenylyltransferase/sulfurtransferase